MDDLQIFSVDDHILEPPHTWQSRLPEQYREVGPRVVHADMTDAATRGRLGGSMDWTGVLPDRLECWAYEDRLMPIGGLSAALRADDDGEFSKAPIGFADMRPGCYEPNARVADMDIDGCVASMGFPSFPRFCGQIFKEAEDKDLALLCVQAYNDFIIDEWCAAAPGRLVPLGIMPLWDVDLAVAEMDRTIAKGMRGFTFSEVPARLGLPSIHDASRHWDPVLAAAADAGTPLCLHIGSSSQVIVTSSDAPDSVMVALFPLNAMIGVTDWIFSGVFDRHPKLQIALSEGGIGWIPFMLERADYTWHHQRWDRTIPRPPSTYFHDHIHGCFIDDAHGAKNIDDIGVDNCMMEVDYPHSDSTWPNTIEIASKHLSTLTPEQKLKVSRTNAERLFRFQPTGIGQR